MDASILERLQPLSGVLAIAFLIAGSLVSGIDGFMIAPERLAAKVEAGRIRILFGAYLSVTAAFLLIWFGDSLRYHLNEVGGAGERFSLVAFGGMVAAAVVIGAGLGIRGAGVERAGLPELTMVALHDVNNMLGGKVLPVLLAATVAVTGLAALQTPIFPAWFGWVSLALTLGLLSPINFYFVVGGLIWIAVSSVWLFVK